MNDNGVFSLVLLYKLSILALVNVVVRLCNDDGRLLAYIDVMVSLSISRLRSLPTQALNKHNASYHNNHLFLRYNIASPSIICWRRIKDLNFVP